MGLNSYNWPPSSPDDVKNFRRDYFESERLDIYFGIVLFGFAAGAFGPYVTQNYEQSIWCLRLSALTYWGTGIWICLAHRRAAKTPAAARRWRSIPMIVSIAGLPALAAFTPLLEPFKEHLKLLGLVSFLFYIFAAVVLGVTLFVGALNQKKSEGEVAAD